MKKHALLVCLLLAMTIIPPIGCDCPDLALSDFYTHVSAYPPTDTAYVESDSVYLSLFFNWGVMAQITDEPIFNNSLYAFSCAEILGVGLTDIRITSNNEFNGIPPGINLSDIFTCHFDGIQFIDDCIRTLFPKDTEDLHSNISFLFLQAPTTFKEHVFTVRLTDENNSKFRPKMPNRLGQGCSQLIYTSSPSVWVLCR